MICRECVKIENLLQGFREPSILDLKLGTRLYGDDATSQKKAQMIKTASITTTGSLGIRITGMRVSFSDQSLFRVFIVFISSLSYIYFLSKGL